MSIEVGYSFFADDNGMDTRAFIENEVLKLAVKSLKQVYELDDYRGVLVLMQSIQEFAPDWLFLNYDPDNLRPYQDLKYSKDWTKLIYALQSAIWEACFYLNEYFDDNSAIEEYRAMFDLYRLYTDTDQDSTPVQNESSTNLFWTKHFLPKKMNILPQLIQNGQTIYLDQVFRDIDVLEIPVIIAQILKLWQDECLDLTFDQYNTLSKVLIELIKIPLDSRWKSWYEKFLADELAPNIDQVMNSAQLTWYQALDSLKKEWRDFGKQRFLKSESVPQVSSSKLFSEKQLPEHFKISVLKDRSSNPKPKRGQSIAITGKFGVERDVLKSFLCNYGYEVVSDIKADINYILVGFNPGAKLEKAEELDIKKLNFFDIINMLVLS